jgi:type I restriction enzyme R subunit
VNIVLMRPVNSMIEFKQIIGRGTRLCEGKG